MKHNRYVWVPLTIAGLVALLFCPRNTEACASDYERVDVIDWAPDADPSAYVSGRLGLLNPNFKTSALVVAYRWLSGVGLDAEEAQSARWVTLPFAANAPWVPTIEGIEVWRLAHREVLGTEAPVQNAGYLRTTDYAAADNCLAAAFEKAAEVLRARAREHGVSAEVRAWGASQDAVFANCERNHSDVASGFTPLPALVSGAPAWLAKDYAYQVAAANFYAERYADAERMFLQISADSDSPWAPYGAYLAARSVTRSGDLGRAQRMLSQLAPAQGSPLSARAIAGYRQHLLIRQDARAAHASIAARIATTHVGADFGSLTYDYAITLDSTDTDPIAAWRSNLVDGSPGAYDFALQQFESSHAQSWLVAALIHARRGSTRVASLIAAAASLERSAPAFVTARYHAARVLAESGNAPRAYAMLDALKRELTSADGPSAMNAARKLAVTVAPSVDALAENAFVAPIGEHEGFAAGVRVADGVAGLNHEAARALASGLPLTAIVAFARSPSVPATSRPILIADAYVRAALLNQESVRTELAPTVTRLVPDSAPYIRAIESANTEDARRLSLIDLLLHIPDLGIFSPEHYDVVPTRSGIHTSYSTYGWPTLPSDEDVPPCAFLTRSERRARDREIEQLRSFGPSANFIPRELLRVAPQFSNDPRVPELLHLAVNLTRFGNEYDSSSNLSRDVFRYLHRTYPNHPMTALTRFHY